MKVRSGLAACGVIAVVAVAGCSSGGGNPASSAAGNGTTAQPSWAAGLGSGVTVEAPAANPASGSPAAAVLGFLQQSAQSNGGSMCNYVDPGYQSTCQSALSAGGSSDTMSGLSLGYTVIDGDHALVAFTYSSMCENGDCQTVNSDPAAPFDGGQSFSALWQNSLDESSTTAYAPAPCVEDNGTWYVDLSDVANASGQ